MWSHVADQRGTNEETVAIKLAAGPVVVVKRTGLNCVALLNEILPKNVCDVNVLPAAVEPIQAAVRVFFELSEVSNVVLITIVAETAEDACAKIVVRENE